jgi:hypothetical protein
MESGPAMDAVDDPAGSPRSDPKREAAREASRKGGLKGGPARAKKLSAARRSEIARKAAEARWRRYRKVRYPLLELAESLAEDR